MPRNYWMMITSLENFQITRSLGFTAQGLKVHHQRKAQRIEPGDRILYYIRGKRYFAATATAMSRYFEDHSGTWKGEGAGDWVLRVQIQPAIVLDEQEFIDARQLAPRLDYVRKWPPENWHIAFAQSNLHILPKKDFVLVEEEMRRIKVNGSKRHPGGPAVFQRQVGAKP
jgi:predicted RNA-binding protein